MYFTVANTVDTYLYRNDCVKRIHISISIIFQRTNHEKQIWHLDKQFGNFQ